MGILIQMMVQRAATIQGAAISEARRLSFQQKGQLIFGDGSVQGTTVDIYRHHKYREQSSGLDDRQGPKEVRKDRHNLLDGASLHQEHDSTITVSAVSRSPSFAAKPSPRPSSVVSIYSPHPNAIPLPPSVASRPSSAASLRTPTAPPIFYDTHRDGLPF